jgi:nitroreductase
MADFFAVASSQRACRQFTQDPVGDADVAALLQAATWAPSAENRQPWVFVVVRDVGVRARIGDLTRQAWRTGARAYSEKRLDRRLLADVDHGAEGGVSAAPVLIVVSGDTQVGLPASLPSSIFPAVQNLLLAATAMGLGSALTTLTTAFADDLRELVGLPETVVPMAVVPVGWPARPLGQPRRLPVADKAHQERYGHRWDPVALSERH